MSRLSSYLSNPSDAMNTVPGQGVIRSHKWVKNIYYHPDNEAKFLSGPAEPKQTDENSLLQMTRMFVILHQYYSSPCLSSSVLL